ncbi:Ig-like domain-containing protein [Sphingobacterium griseoflavum]|uniref:Ig-like domain-containing protein n=1 Tax=Sphingobacterium griseoflavum TaxID=1474952 RepID=UPI00167B5DD4|nr:Ig-like domain-containing protein [Sphingobacterium griseoflavum]
MSIKESTLNTAANQMELTVAKGKSIQITPIFMPRNYPNTQVQYSFSAGGIATVSADNMFTGLAVGTDTLVISASNIRTRYVVKVSAE